ncbi:Mariner Mos1 transposase [Eumeta japonica]|uniref:Mariner Mos1 transposase n=1 Tax=Eumeta variegata TaxID=151549 RepID=A0A4C1VVS7_EUMVA|nr:Mariner Mos1 transposase [Eumeta japonica]
MLLSRHRKVFYIESSLVMKSDNPKKRKPWGLPGHASTFTAKLNIHGKKLMICIWWDQLGEVYYELLNPSETITGTLYRIRLMRLTRALKEKFLQYYSRHHKIILLHDNARPHVAVTVKYYLKTLGSKVPPHSPYSPDIAPSDYHLFRSVAHALSEQRFTSYEDTKPRVDSWITSKDKEFFRLGIRTLPERWKKVSASDGQYFD